MWALDPDVDPERGEDGPADLRQLQQEHGELPDTRIHRTPRGGEHQLYLHDPRVGAGRGALPKSIDVRGEGSYFIVPPSPGYTVERSVAVVEAPEWLITLIERKPEGKPSLRSEPASTPVTLEGPPVFEGYRHIELRRFLGRAHDGTRSLKDLISLAEQFNAQRCSPPIGSPEDDHKRGDPERFARWVYSQPPCSPAKERDPKVDEVLERCAEYFYAEMLPGGGKSKLRDIYRAHETLAAIHGTEVRTIEIDGEQRRAVPYNASTRQLAEEGVAGVGSASRNSQRLIDPGLLRKDGERSGTQGESWLLIEPAQNWNTRNSASLYPQRNSESECSTFAHPPRPDQLQTPVFGWRSPVGNARAGTLIALEAFGPHTVEELRDRVSPRARLRDFQARHVDVLAALGLIEERDGVVHLPGDHRERVSHARAEPYAVTLRRERESWDPIREQWEHHEAEYGPHLSDDQRDERRRRKHREDRRRYRLRLVQDSEVESVAFDQLPPANDPHPEPDTGELTPERQMLTDAGWVFSGYTFGVVEWMQPVTHEVHREDVAFEIEQRRSAA